MLSVTILESVCCCLIFCKITGTGELSKAFLKLENFLNKKTENGFSMKMASLSLCREALSLLQEHTEYFSWKNKAIICAMKWVVQKGSVFFSFQ